MTEPQKLRPPRAFKLEPGKAPAGLVREPDAFTAINAAAPDAPPRRRAGWFRPRFPLGAVFWTAAGLFVALAAASGIASSISGMFAQSAWLAYAGAALAAVAALALIAIIAREWLAMRRLGRAESIRAMAADALRTEDQALAADAAEQLENFCRAMPGSAAGRTRLAEARRGIIDGLDLLKLAERELLHPADAEVKRLISETAKRVSLVTALSPRALFDVLFVLAQSVIMVRRIAAAYGARPSAAGGWKLARAVLGQLAVTGGLAAGESMLSQALGAGLAARLSAKLGEGVLNGVLAARVGLAAISVLRPMPFANDPPPGVTDLAAGLLSG